MGDDSKAAEKQCKIISSDKDVQKACKKVVKDVLKKGKDKLDSCKIYGWCPRSRTRAFLRARRTAECVCEDEPTSSPTNRVDTEPTSLRPTKTPTLTPTSNPTNSPTSNPTNSPTEHPTLVPTDPLPDDECG